MKPIRHILLTGLVAFALSACGEGEQPKAQGQNAVSGKILERSISDDMLPYDTVSSQPPLADPEKAEGATGTSDSASDSSDDAATGTPEESSQPDDSDTVSTPDGE